MISKEKISAKMEKLYLILVIIFAIFFSYFLYKVIIYQGIEAKRTQQVHDYYEDKEEDSFSRKEKCMKIGKKFALDKYDESEISDIQYRYNPTLETCIVKISKGNIFFSEGFLEIYDSLTGELLLWTFGNEIYKAKKEGGSPELESYVLFSIKEEVYFSESPNWKQWDGMDMFKALDKKKQNDLLNRAVKEGTITHKEAMKIAEELKK